MRKEEIVSTLHESIGAVLRQKYEACQVAFAGTTLEAVALELANNSAAPLALFLELEAESEYGAIDMKLDACGIPRTSDGITDAYSHAERISLLAQQRNAAERRACELQAELDNIKQEQRKMKKADKESISKIMNAMAALARALPGPISSVSIGLHGAEAAVSALADVGAEVTRYEDDSKAYEWNAATIEKRVADCPKVSITAYGDHRKIQSRAIDHEAVDAALKQASEALS